MGSANTYTTAAAAVAAATAAEPEHSGIWTVAILTPSRRACSLSHHLSLNLDGHCIIPYQSANMSAYRLLDARL